ncbi:protein of unknown function [Acidithiobacillus ferrivorans]|uniref:Uncharacterized protein n=1 Tax=Acidithiobacillus ferrivorans TaxID=160808 RepID=A0A060UUI3_9PROT|nr:hypothetical protein AFERRI_10115 [Acidithiobacillus ferrivorans]SMH65164.1 protein of unknown function [Acidithiobacillus ferrivorans]
MLAVTPLARASALDSITPEAMSATIIGRKFVVLRIFKTLPLVMIGSPKESFNESLGFSKREYHNQRM